MTNQNYAHLAKVLHWLVAGLIVAQYVLAKLAERAKSNDELLDQLALLANHKSIGMTILALAVIRVLFRLRNKPPALPLTMPVWQRVASNISHLLLYGFLFALPVTGWLMSSAKAYSVSWFNWFTFPDLVAPDESLADVFLTAHHYLSEALFIIALLHILAALKHQFVDRDDVLRRMSGAGSWALLAATVALTIVVFGRFINTPETTAEPHSASQSQADFTASELPFWNIDYADSYIKFSGNQAGAPFTGQWQEWQAEIQFDKAQLESARFNVTIAPNSVSSNDQERDNHIRSEQFFHVEQFPEASYQASEFETSENGFTAHGQLLMKGLSHTATLTFAVVEKDGLQILTGTAPLDRLVWNIGTGDWQDTSWVGQEVMVEVRVVADTAGKQR